ncbi:MAG TPA: mannose-6-phosphate isomerase, class I, partial [Micromonosporaceae bacterium]|nr:mannose-6-phosphate isomerase, class I [Micromonosporaceae bacterium]
RLPYLLKVLAAEQALSLQVHPDADQARAGFAAEERAGVPIEAKHRNYVDPYHKPELLVALTEFDALCGFRHPELSAETLVKLGVPALDPVVAALRTGGTVPERLRGAMRLLLGWPADTRAQLVSAVAAAGRDAGLALPATLAEMYPADPGVVIALLLNHVTLRPGEAIFMPAGNLHAYLRGMAIEVMAASDNVLRCGLTPKHVDVAEATRVLRYEVLSDPVLRPTPVAPGIHTWPVPVEDFSLVRADTAAGVAVLPGGGPRIVVCVQGTADLRAGEEALRLASGRAVLVGANEPPVQVGGSGAVVFQASPGGV